MDLILLESVIKFLGERYFKRNLQGTPGEISEEAFGGIPTQISQKFIEKSLRKVAGGILIKSLKEFLPNFLKKLMYKLQKQSVEELLKNVMRILGTW